MSSSADPELIIHELISRIKAEVSAMIVCITEVLTTVKLPSKTKNSSRPAIDHELRAGVENCLIKLSSTNGIGVVVSELSKLLEQFKTVQKKKNSTVVAHHRICNGCVGF